MLQSPLVSALRHRAATDPAGVLQEVKQLLTVRGPMLKTFSPSEIHQLKELDHDLELGPVGGAGPVTRSRKRKPVGISVLESPAAPQPSVQSSSSPAIRRSEKSAGHAPMISPAVPAPQVQAGTPAPVSPRAPVPPSPRAMHLRALPWLQS